MLQRALLVGMTGLAAFIFGCGNSNSLETVEITGTIKVNGQPVEGLQVNFRTPDGPQAIGVTDAEGKYQLTLPGGNKGGQIGTNTVAIIGRDPKISPESIAEMKADAEASGKPFVDPTKLPIIPAKYNEKTELSADVSADQHVFDFDLQVPAKK